MPLHEQQVVQIHYSLKREINELYWALALKGFATGLLGIFVPIYVFLYFDQSLVATLIFYAIQFAGHTLLVPWVAQLIKRLGVKKMMAIGNPFLAAYIILLAVAPGHGLVIIGLALLAKIIYMSFFWPAFHIDFARFVKEEQRGRQLGKAQVVVVIAKAAAPLLAGVAIVQFGFPVVFIVGALLIVLSSVPLFFSSEVYEEYTLSWTASFKSIFKPEHRRTGLAFFFQGFERVSGLVLFPIFIYTVVANLETIGWVTSFSLVFALATAYTVGWLSDKKGSSTVLDFSSIAHSFAWIINSFITTVSQFAIYSTFFRVTEIASILPFVATFYRRAKRAGHGIDEYVMFHEIVHNFGKLFFLGLVILGLSLGVTAWPVYFTITAVAALLFQLINRREDTLWAKIKNRLAR